MTKLHNLKKTATPDWHVADIKCALEKKGWSLARLARLHGYSRNATAWAMYVQWPKVEKIIADAIGVSPRAIWPSRYDEHGNSTRDAKGRGRPQKNANTAAVSGVIQPNLDR